MSRHRSAGEPRRARAHARRCEVDLPERFEQLAEQVRRAWGLNRVNPDRHSLHRIGRFEALRRLGQGSYGVVYKVRDPELGREVALKLFPTPGPAAAEAFLREAQVLAKFSHPNIVRAFETGRYGDDFFFVMELVDGITGHEFIADWADVDEVLEVYEAAGAGLAAAHGEGILHRDFKPSNVLLGFDGRVCVADFGLASVMASHADEHVRYRVGTLPYMAPEVLRGERADVRADQWSFCVALWETLHARRPFAGETAEELLAAIERGQPDAGELTSEIPKHVRAAVQVGLSIDPADRYPDMHSLIATLRRIRLPATDERERSRGVFFWAMLLALGVMVGSLASALVIGSRQRPPTPEATPAEPVPVVDPVVEHVLGLIAADQFEKAHEIWDGETNRRRVMGIDTRADTRRIVEAFNARATALADQDPTRSKAAAIMAATWSPMQSDSTH